MEPEKKTNDIDQALDEAWQEAEKKAEEERQEFLKADAELEVKPEKEK